MNSFADEVAVVQLLLQNAPTSGAYFLPHPGDMTAMSDDDRTSAYEALQKKMDEGPFLFAAVRLGPGVGFGRLMAVQFVLDLLTAFLICLALRKTAELSFTSRVVTAVLVALVGFAGITLPHWNWYQFGDAHTLAELGDTLGGSLLAGMVISRLGFRAKNAGT